MTCASNCDMYMATGYTDTGTNTTGTGWTANMLVYITGPAGNSTNAGAINLGANGSIYLTGPPTGSAYMGMLFFQDRSSVAQSHSLGGGGNLRLLGTIYPTNTLGTMSTTPAQYQSLSLQGGSGSSTLQSCRTLSANLLGRFRNNQQHFHSGGLPVLTRRPKLPLLQRIQQEFHLGKLGGKHQGQSLEASSCIDKSMHQ